MHSTSGKFVFSTYPWCLSRSPYSRSGEGRGDEAGRNLYENFAESTSGSASSLPEYGVNFAIDALNMEAAAAEEEAKDKSIKADFVKEQLRRRLGEDITDGTRSAPPAPGDGLEVSPKTGAVEELKDEDNGEVTGNAPSSRARGSMFFFLFFSLR